MVVLVDHARGKLLPLRAFGELLPGLMLLGVLRQPGRFTRGRLDVVGAQGLAHDRTEHRPLRDAVDAALRTLQYHLNNKPRVVHRCHPHDGSGVAAEP